jgi:hypothetical protein
MIGYLAALRPACCVLLLSLAACATTPPRAGPAGTGSASWQAEEPPPGTIRYKLKLGDISMGANLAGHVAPVYPPSLLGACPAPVEVSALLIVDRAGKVAEVRIAHAQDADAQRRLFIAATRTAARQWQFSPLLISHWAADAEGNSHVVDSATHPFSLPYVFRFECHGGKARVSSDSA